MIKVISFDIGGTLLKGPNNETYSNKNLAALINKDYNIVLDAYKNIFQKQIGSFDELISRFCKEVNYPRNQIIDKFFYDKFNTNEGVINQEDIKVIKKIKEKGYKIILLSNSCCLYKDALTSELLSLVDHIFYSYNLGYTKEDNEIYKLIEAKTGNLPFEFLHIGDTIISDYLKPRENGWKVLYYGNPQDNTITSINNLNEIFNYLKE